VRALKQILPLKEVSRYPQPVVYGGISVPLNYPVPQQTAGPPDALQVLMLTHSCKKKLWPSSPPLPHSYSVPELSFGASHSLLFSNPNAASPSAPFGCSWQNPRLPSLSPCLPRPGVWGCVSALQLSERTLPERRQRERVPAGVFPSTFSSVEV